MILVTDYCFTSGIARRIRKAGDSVILIHHRQTSKKEVEELVQLAKGVVFSGGNDISPRYYDQDNVASFGVDSIRDLFELMILSYVRKYGKKALGLCRGHQLLNVAAGGTLYQDITMDGFEHTPPHNVILSGFGKELFNKELVRTNSMHHQGVKALGNGFEAIAKHANDNLVEGIYNPELQWLGVQWHPEAMSDTQEVFDWLVKEE